MKKIIMTIAAAAVLFAACDKIDAGEDGRFVEYAGATASWDETTPLANAMQRAFIEKYTGPKCPNCPYADVDLDNAHRVLRDTLVMVSINPSWGDGEPIGNDPDMSTDDGDQWATVIGGGTNMSMPFGKLNRTVSYGGAMGFKTVKDDADSAIAKEVKVAIDVEATAIGSNVGIDVTVDFRQQVAENLTLTLVLSEDSLRYKQLWQNHNPFRVDDYAHNHMLRDVITDVWGVDVKAEGRVGEARKAHFNYTLPDGVVKENCHIVAFVSYKETREILNCAESDIQ